MEKLLKREIRPKKEFSLVILNKIGILVQYFNERNVKIVILMG